MATGALSSSGGYIPLVLYQHQSFIAESHCITRYYSARCQWCTWCYISTTECTSETRVCLNTAVGPVTAPTAAICFHSWTHLEHLMLLRHQMLLSKASIREVSQM